MHQFAIEKRHTAVILNTGSLETISHCFGKIRYLIEHIRFFIYLNRYLYCCISYLTIKISYTVNKISNKVELHKIFTIRFLVYDIRCLLKDMSSESVYHVSQIV